MENFRSEADRLKIPQKMALEAEELMEKGVEKFQVRGELPGDRGPIDLVMDLKKSGQSDYYYLNRFEVIKSNAKPLQQGQEYIISSLDRSDGHNSRRFTNAVMALDYFREKKGDFELSAGKFSEKDMSFRDVLATMKDGKVDYVKQEFRTTFYAPVIRNTVYVDRGKGFSAEQAANMLQGRAVFRDDLQSRAGERYSAWSQYQFDQPKDRYGNYTMKQFGEGYGFDLKKELSGFEIREMGEKASMERLLAELQNGGKPLVHVQAPDGSEKILRIEAVPRYTNLNFFELSGKPVKRETLKKEESAEKVLEQDKAKNKRHGKAQENELTL